MAAGIPVWNDDLEAAERAALRPGIPSSLDPRPDVLVVGGGVQGLATAAACRELGLGSVVLIERDHLASGPSGSAAGTLCPDSHLDVEGPAFVSFAHASLRRHAALAAEAGPALRLRWLDWLLLAPAASSRLHGAAGVRALDEPAVRGLVPGLAIEAGGLLVSRGQAHVNPLRLAAVLAARAGAVATGVSYLGLRVRGGRVVAVRTSAGDLSPGAVVLATGMAPAELLPVRQMRYKGHLAATEAAPVALAAAPSAPGLAIVPLPDGGLLVGGDRVPDDGSPDVDQATIEGFRSRLAELLPACAGLRFTHAWSCARPAVEGLMPVIDRAPGLDNVWLTAGHYTTGLLLAPETGHALATWIASGTAPDSIAPFRLRAY